MSMSQEGLPLERRETMTCQLAVTGPGQAKKAVFLRLRVCASEGDEAAASTGILREEEGL